MTNPSTGRLWRTLQRLRLTIDAAIDDLESPSDVASSDEIAEVRARVSALEARVFAIEKRRRK